MREGDRRHQRWNRTLQTRMCRGGAARKGDDNVEWNAYRPVTSSDVHEGWLDSCSPHYCTSGRELLQWYDGTSLGALEVGREQVAGTGGGLG